ncbi:hypothetical protein HER32_17545 [Hymenobacter sp. BT18]|uniref:hypothetical protein n=1 Tax=Hymenobacter sp. BT18 TaxID=2835648 RepID=UPI00143E3C74|nr:hypothetical protein [Hymenobacter sp. BT18]QIX62880.1 hypothetical protein HER32_17545 [Hymenobacter sp. BT18]
MSLFDDNDISYSQFNRIYVIEVVIQGEWRTGKELYDDTLSKYEFKHPWFTSSYHPIDSKKGLLSLLKQIRSDAATKQIFPYLHFEAHGNKVGLQVSRGVIMKWEDLADELRKINIVTKNNLMVSLASCYGSYILKGARLNQRAPFYGVIAPVERIKSTEIIEAYNILYDNIVNSDDIHKAIDLIRANIQQPTSRITYIHSETVFRAISENLARDMREPIYRQKRILEMTAKHMSNVHLRLNNTIPQIIDRITNVVNNSDNTFIQMIQHFRMDDLK